MDREIKARREYAKKWSFMSKPEVNQFYDQKYLSKKIEEMVPEGLHEIVCTTTLNYSVLFTGKLEESSNVGESYFVSKNMFNALNVIFILFLNR